MWLVALNLLWLVPPLVLWATRKRHIAHPVAAAGLAFGAIVSPASLGLYSFYFFGAEIGGILGTVLALGPGLVGLWSEMFHGAPGYEIAVGVGLVPARTVVEGYQHLVVGLFNSVLWAAIYGLLGFLIDFIRARKRRPRMQVHAA